MTKQEYMDKFNAAWFSGARCGKLKAATEIKDEYISSLEEDNANLKVEIAQLKKDKFEFYAQCFYKDVTISVLKNHITELEFDNRSLVEQMNKMALKPNQEVIEWHECSEGCPQIADIISFYVRMVMFILIGLITDPMKQEIQRIIAHGVILSGSLKSRILEHTR